MRLRLGYNEGDKGAIIPGHRAHMGFALLIWGMFAAGGTSLNIFLMLLASVFPDADHRHAPIGRILPLWLFFKHRGWVHSVWSLLLTTLIFAFGFSWLGGLSWFIGYGTHLMLDAITPSGINFWGKRKKAR